MGAKLSCPSGFESGIFSCHATCPAEFKFVGEPGNPPKEKCVHVYRNDKSFQLISLPQLEDIKTIPPVFEEETKRVENEAAKLRGEIERDKLLRESKGSTVKEYDRIQSDYAIYTENVKAIKEIKKVKDSLKPFRPPTAPSSDLEKERKEITDLAKRDLFYAQVALFLVVLVGLSYVTLPVETANVAALLLLFVGIGFGFFLRR